MLKGKHIVVGISGGIAAYKIPEFIRLLRKAGAEVKVTCTKNALNFVTTLTLETLSNNRVYSDVFAPINEHSTEHISLPDWADLMIVAPATANVIGKMANGIADDALTTTFLAMQKPVLIAPAMNDKMYAHPAVQKNMETLRSWSHVTMLDCAEGFLACGTVGKGRMQEIEVIFNEASLILSDKRLAGKRVLITAGPTQEKIDPVRYISNYSTGKMGVAIANAAALQHAEVTLILGPSNVMPTYDMKVIRVTSAEEMYQAAMKEFENADVAILSAAVADFSPMECADKKIKREKDDLVLNLKPTQDIAAHLGQQKRPEQMLIGFALETNDELQHALDKMKRKNFDFIVLNSLQDAGAGFGYDTNKVTILGADGTTNEYELKAKDEVAEDILQLIH